MLLMSSCLFWTLYNWYTIQFHFGLVLDNWSYSFNSYDWHCKEHSTLDFFLHSYCISMVTSAYSFHCQDDNNDNHTYQTKSQLNIHVLYNQLNAPNYYFYITHKSIVFQTRITPSTWCLCPFFFWCSPFDKLITTYAFINNLRGLSWDLEILISASLLHSGHDTLMSYSKYLLLPPEST